MYASRKALGSRAIKPSANWSVQAVTQSSAWLTGSSGAAGGASILSKETAGDHRKPNPFWRWRDGHRRTTRSRRG